MEATRAAEWAFMGSPAWIRGLMFGRRGAPVRMQGQNVLCVSQTRLPDGPSPRAPGCRMPSPISHEHVKHWRRLEHALETDGVAPGTPGVGCIDVRRCATEICP